MFYLTFGLLFLSLQSFLIISTKVNIFPELFFFPWLVSKGLLPYRDFFDHHGFLLYYLLAPLVKDSSLFFLKQFYFFIQGVNLILILIILRKVSNKLGFVLGGTIFVLVNYFISDANLWYELIISFFYLLIFFISQEKITNKNQILGFLIALVSFIKPTAAIILLPVLYIARRLPIIVYFSIPWFLVGSFFWMKNGLRQMIDNLFLFNSYLSKNYHEPYFSDEKFLAVAALIILVSIILNILHKKVKTIIPTLLFLFNSFIFVFYAYTRYHLVPISVFFVILIAQTIKNSKGLYKYLFIGLVLFYVLFSAKKTIFQYKHFRSSTTWIENPTSRKVANEMKNPTLKDKKFYVFGNQPEIYMFLDQLPPTHYPLVFPMIRGYIPNLQNQFINELSREKVEAIIIPKPRDKQFARLSKVEDYIYINYSLFKKEKEFDIYILRK